MEKWDGACNQGIKTNELHHLLWPQKQVKSIGIKESDNCIHINCGTLNAKSSEERNCEILYELIVTANVNISEHKSTPLGVYSCTAKWLIHTIHEFYEQLTEVFLDIGKQGDIILMATQMQDSNARSSKWSDQRKLWQRNIQREWKKNNK